jgi:preprotein translocase subunit SecD
MLEVPHTVSSPRVASCCRAAAARSGRLAADHPPGPAWPGSARGTQIVLEAKDSPDRRVDGDTVARALEVLRRRVDQLGVAEPTLQRSGERRVIVELPGVYDPKEATEVIGRTAQLAFHPVLGVAEPDPEKPATTEPPADSDELVLADEDGGRLRLGPAALTGEAVGDAGRCWIPRPAPVGRSRSSSKGSATAAGPS